ncbi:MAG: hypothetical protein LBG27_04445 [Spirochaetaceae bacterium]|jgi:hypothetical protein|nr:hypothetical protein [Spirochaetaceae bacterium]
MRKQYLSEKDAPPSNAARKSRCGVMLFILFLALAPGFSGCGFLRDLGLVFDVEDPDPTDTGSLMRPPVVDGSSPSIKAKFGVTATEKRA